MKLLLCNNCQLAELVGPSWFKAKLAGSSGVKLVGGVGWIKLVNQSWLGWVGWAELVGQSWLGQVGYAKLVGQSWLGQVG